MKKNISFGKAINVYFNLIDKVLILTGLISLIVIISIQMFLTDYIIEEYKGISIENVDSF